MIELAGMVSMDEEENGVISESMQLTKWGRISAWSNLALVTSTPRTSAQQLQIVHSHYHLFVSLYIHQVNYERWTKTSSDREIADKVSASWLLYRES